MKSDTTAFIHDGHQEATLKGICSALRTAASEWGRLWDTYCSSPAPLPHPVPQASQGRTLGHVLGWREFIPVTYAPFNTQEPGKQTSMQLLVRSGAHFELLWYCNADPILTKVLIFHSTTKMSMLMHMRICGSRFWVEWKTGTERHRTTAVQGPTAEGDVGYCSMCCFCTCLKVP